MLFPLKNLLFAAAVHTGNKEAARENQCAMSKNGWYKTTAGLWANYFTWTNSISWGHAQSNFCQWKWIIRLQQLNKWEYYCHKVQMMMKTSHVCRPHVCSSSLKVSFVRFRPVCVKTMYVWNAISVDKTLRQSTLFFSKCMLDDNSFFSPTKHSFKPLLLASLAIC